MTTQETNISYIYNSPWKGYLSLHVTSQIGSIMTFFASKPKKGKRSGRYVSMKHFRKWKNSVLVSLEVLGVLEGDEMTDLKI